MIVYNCPLQSLLLGGGSTYTIVPCSHYYRVGGPPNVPSIGPCYAKAC